MLMGLYVFSSLVTFINVADMCKKLNKNTEKINVGER